MVEFKVHKHPKDFDAACMRLEKDNLLTEHNKKLILKFAKTKLVNGISKLRIVKCMYCLRFLAHWHKKPFEEATKEDIIQLVGEIENQNYSANTKYDFKVILKLFYKWLKGNDETYPTEVVWLKPRTRRSHKLPEELITQEEVLQMANVADHPRNKAFVLVLYETGCRIGELLSLKMKNVQFDQYGAILRVTGKTGDRRVRIISSTADLAHWINTYPYSKEPDAPLWPSLATNYKYAAQPAEYTSMNVVVHELAKKAGINKRIYPHLFRHSRATFLAGKLTEAQMKEYLGWTQSSDMASVYVHLSGRDVDNALLAMQGLAQTEDKIEDKFQLKNCARCQEKNSPSSKFCNRCGTPTDISALPSIEQRKVSDELLNTLMQNSEFKEYLAKKVVEMGLHKNLA